MLPSPVCPNVPTTTPWRFATRSTPSRSAGIAPIATATSSRGVAPAAQGRGRRGDGRPSPDVPRPPRRWSRPASRRLPRTNRPCARRRRRLCPGVGAHTRSCRVEVEPHGLQLLDGTQGGRVHELKQGRHRLMGNSGDRRPGAAQRREARRARGSPPRGWQQAKRCAGHDAERSLQPKARPSTGASSW